MYDYGARLYDPARAGWSNIDPKAEKYYGFSPYVYVANNPINAIDPDGKDIIFITRNNNGSVKEQFKYRNGNFYHENGKRYNPSKENVSKTMYGVLSAYRKIEASGNKELKNMLHTLETSKNKHYIESGQSNEVSSKVSNLSIQNHKSTEKVKNNEGVDTRTTHNFTAESKEDFQKSEGIPNSNLTTVTHEMRHQYDYDQGKMADSVDKSGAEDPAEKRAVESENVARKIDGLPKRTTYGGVKIIQD